MFFVFSFDFAAFAGHLISFARVSLIFFPIFDFPFCTNRKECVTHGNPSVAFLCFVIVVSSSPSFMMAAVALLLSAIYFKPREGPRNRMEVIHYYSRCIV